MSKLSVGTGKIESISSKELKFQSNPSSEIFTDNNTESEIASKAKKTVTTLSSEESQCFTFVNSSSQ